MSADRDARPAPDDVEAWVTIFKACSALIPTTCPPYLKERNWRILRLWGCEGASYASIARDGGVSLERIRQIVRNNTHLIVAHRIRDARKPEERPPDGAIAYVFVMPSGASPDDSLVVLDLPKRAVTVLTKHGITTVGALLDHWHELHGFRGMGVATFVATWGRLVALGYVVAADAREAEA
jgi:hypothetical protein